MTYARTCIRLCLIGVLPLLHACGKGCDRKLFAGTLKSVEGQVMFHSASTAEAYAVVEMPETRRLAMAEQVYRITAEADVDYNCHIAGSSACMSIGKIIDFEAM